MGFTFGITNRVMGNKKLHFPLFLILLTGLSFAMILCYPIHPGHDFHFHFLRFNALIEAINNGTFPNYIDYSAIGGYGYFTKAFYSDFLLIPFALIGTITNSLFAYKLMLFTMTVLCGIFTYKTIDIIYKNSVAASIGAILYTFAYYRLLDIYRRGALGESLSFTFIPIVILGIYHIIKGDYKKWYILTIGYSLMIFSHIISSVLMFITMLIILITYYKPLVKEPKRIGYLILSGLVSLIILAYYLYPMLEQMASDSFYYETNQPILPHHNQLTLYQLVWGLFSGVIYPKQIFVPGTGMILTWVILTRLFIQEKSPYIKSIDRGVILGIIYIFAASVLFPWDIFPFNKFNIIQLPWRLFEFTSYFFAIAGGFYISLLLKSNKQIIAGIITISIITLLAMGSDGRDYTYVHNIREIDEKPTVGTRYQLGSLEYLPTKVPSLWYLEVRGNNTIEKANKETQITDFHRNRNITSFDLTTTNSDTLELPLVYYKGYKATVNNIETTINESDYGLIQIPVDQDQSGRVEIYYAGTTTQKVSIYITLIGIFALCIYIFRIKIKK